MDPTKNQDLASEPQAAKEEVPEEEVIDLTDVLNDETSETVIEISTKMDELDSLDLKTLLSEEPETEPRSLPRLTRQKGMNLWKTSFLP